MMDKQDLVFWRVFVLLALMSVIVLFVYLVRGV